MCLDWTRDSISTVGKTAVDAVQRAGMLAILGI